MSESVNVGAGKGGELIAFNIGSQEFCISTTSVREITRLTPATALPHAPPFVLGVVNLRGVVLPIVDLAVRLGFPQTEPTARHAIIVVEFGTQVAGLLVTASPTSSPPRRSRSSRRPTSPRRSPSSMCAASSPWTVA